MTDQQQKTPAPETDYGDEDVQLVQAAPSVLSAITNSEILQQLDAAHRYPRSIARFQKTTLEIATSTADVAASCMYSLKRGNKHIVGPSVRLAEIVAGTWQNMHAGARPMDVRETDVVAQGVAWDLQNNVKITVECVRRITDSEGRRYNEDMIGVTQNAANSIALRNAIFRVVPRALISPLFSLVMKAAVGEAKSMSQRRTEQLSYLANMGADEASVLAALGRADIDEITIDDIAVLIDYGQALHQGVKRVEEIFPDVSKPGPMPTGEKPQQGRRMPLGKAAAPATKSTPTTKPATTGAPAQGQQPLPTTPPAGTGAGAPAEDPDKANRDAAAPTAEEMERGK